MTWVQLVYLTLVLGICTAGLCGSIQKLASVWQSLIDQSKKQSALLAQLEQIAKLQQAESLRREVKH